MDTLKFKVIGECPLLLHNARLANPLDPLVKQIKQITSKKKKTEEDQLEIFRLEWQGGLYFDEDLGPYVPGLAVEACIKEAARLQKRGKDVLRGLMVMSDKCPLKYKWPRDIDSLYANEQFVDIRSVVIGGRRTMRCRPIFREWELEAPISYDPEVLNRDDVVSFLRDAGRYIGLLEMRPRYGRFMSEVVNGQK